jgi:hypothetical protein
MSRTHHTARRSGVLGALLAALAVTATALALTAPSAAALVVCRGSGQQTYTPGITNSVGNVNVTDRLRIGTFDNPLLPCTGLGVRASGGRVDLAYPKEVSCTDPFSPASTTSLVITWDTGATSTYTNSSTITQANGQAIVTSTGRMTAGLYSGHAVIGVITYLELSAGELLACATPEGLTNSNSLIELTIL